MNKEDRKELIIFILFGIFCMIWFVGLILFTANEINNNSDMFKGNVSEISYEQ